MGFVNRLKPLLACTLVLAGLLLPARAQSLEDMNLRAAINDGRRDEARRLIEQGTDVNGRTSGGYTPLMIAAGIGDEQTVRLLLERGADPALVNDNGWTADYIAKINNHKSIQALLEGPSKTAATAAQPQQAGNTGPSKASSQAGHDSHGWPKQGTYPPGQAVLYSGTAGKTWLADRVKNIDPTYGYNFEGVTGSTDAYFVVGAQREPFWTDWFIGDWGVSVPMAMGTFVKGGDLYRTVSGGLRLPPLRISKDGTYAWRVQEGGQETVLQGRWQPNPDGPGVILKNAAHGADWLVYNNTRTGSSLGHTVILSSDKHTHLDGTRLK